MRVGITGTRRMQPSWRRCIEETLACLPDDTFLVTGGCVGVDTVAAAFWSGRGGKVLTVLPADHKLVDKDWLTHCTQAVQMQDGTTYQERNAQIVTESDRLIAFAEHSEQDSRSIRSGTWQTVRIARKQGIPVEVVMLNG